MNLLLANVTDPGDTDGIPASTTDAMMFAVNTDTGAWRAELPSLQEDKEATGWRYITTQH